MERKRERKGGGTCRARGIDQGRMFSEVDSWWPTTGSRREKWRNTELERGGVEGRERGWRGGGRKTPVMGSLIEMPFNAKLLTHCCTTRTCGLQGPVITLRYVTVRTHCTQDRDQYADQGESREALQIQKQLKFLYNVVC